MCQSTTIENNRELPGYVSHTRWGEPNQRAHVSVKKDKVQGANAGVRAEVENVCNLFEDVLAMHMCVRLCICIFMTLLASLLSVSVSTCQFVQQSKIIKEKLEHKQNKQSELTWEQRVKSDLQVSPPIPGPFFFLFLFFVLIYLWSRSMYTCVCKCAPVDMCRSQKDGVSSITLQIQVSHWLWASCFLSYPGSQEAQGLCLLHSWTWNYRFICEEKEEKEEEEEMEKKEGRKRKGRKKRRKEGKWGGRRQGWGGGRALRHHGNSKTKPGTLPLVVIIWEYSSHAFFSQGSFFHPGSLFSKAMKRTSSWWSLQRLRLMNFISFQVNSLWIWACSKIHMEDSHDHPVLCLYVIRWSSKHSRLYVGVGTTLGVRDVSGLLSLRGPWCDLEIEHEPTELWKSPYEWGPRTVPGSQQMPQTLINRFFLTSTPCFILPIVKHSLLYSLPALRSPGTLNSHLSLLF